MSDWAWLLILAMYLYLIQWLRDMKKDVRRDLGDVLRALQNVRKEQVPGAE